MTTESDGEIRRLRDLVARLASGNPVEHNGDECDFIADYYWCKWCKSELMNRADGYRDPLNHKPDCPWVEALANGDKQ